MFFNLNEINLTLFFLFFIKKTENWKSMEMKNISLLINIV